MSMAGVSMSLLTAKVFVATVDGPESGECHRSAAKLGVPSKNHFAAIGADMKRDNYCTGKVSGVEGTSRWFCEIRMESGKSAAKLLSLELNRTGEGVERRAIAATYKCCPEEKICHLQWFEIWIWIDRAFASTLSGTSRPLEMVLDLL